MTGTLTDREQLIHDLAYEAGEAAMKARIERAADEVMGTTPEPPEALYVGTYSTWQPVDVSAVLDGTYEPPQATVGRRDDGVGLLYPGRVHTVAAESEGGKTWLGLTIVASEINDGRGAVYVDFEDDEGGVVGRLLAVGAKPDAIRQHFAYLRPTEPLTEADNRLDLAGVLHDVRPVVAIVDGVTEAMTLHGLELKDNSDVARFGKLLPRWLADRGPAVLALDHVTKDREGRGRYAIGGVHKLNGVNGAAFVLENRRPFGIGVTGRSTLLVAKDRPGQLRRHALPSGEGMAWLADLVVQSHAAEFAEVSLTPPISDGGQFRPTVLMGRVADVLRRSAEPMTKQDIESRVKGKATDIRTALAALVDDGFVAVTVGRYNARLHSLIKPYGEGA